MFIYRAGSMVGKGTYWNPADGRRVDISDEGVLPGAEGSVYLRFSSKGVLFVAPLLGLMYVMFLPMFGLGIILMIWLWAIFGALAGVVTSAINACGGMAGRSVTFGWTPQSSYLGGRKPKGQEASKDKGAENPETEE